MASTRPASPTPATWSYGSAGWCAATHTGPPRHRHVAAAWNLMTTETHGLNAPGITDTGDLVRRLGRLVYGDPQWTPSRPQRAQRRNPADLPPGPAGAAMIVAA